MATTITMSKLTRRWPPGLNKRSPQDVFVALFFVLFALVFIDVWASQTFQAWPEVWRAPFFFVTEFGLSDWVLIPSLIVTLISLIALRLVPKGLYRRATYELACVSGFIFVGVGLPGLLTNLLKRIIGRSRPVEFLESGAFHFQFIVNDWNFQSFPSGHSATALGTALVIGFMAPRLFKLLLVIALMTGLSRVVVGMHYPTDVFAGFIVGGLGAYAVRNFFSSRRWLFTKLPDGTIGFRGTPNLRRAWKSRFQRARA